MHSGLVSRSEGFQAKLDLDQIQSVQNLNILAEEKQQSAISTSSKPAGVTMKDARAKARALLAPSNAAPAAADLESSA